VRHSGWPSAAFPWKCSSGPRWSAATLIAIGALFVELRPEPHIEVPFALVDLGVGEVIDETNTEIRGVPADLLEGASLGDVTSRPVAAGEPVLISAVDETEHVIPRGWWVVTVTLPQGARVGDQVRVVMLDSGLEVDGVVAGDRIAALVHSQPQGAARGRGPALCT